MRRASASLLLLSSFPAVFSQNQAVLSGLVQTLNSTGHDRLATLITRVNSSVAGPSVLAQLTSGAPYVLFAPNDTALNLVPSNITSDDDLLTDVFAYHIVSGNFSGVATTYPNVTLGSSLLSDPRFVQLEGSGQHQVVAWATRGDGKVHVLNQLNDSIVTNTTTFGNVTIHTVDHVLDIPASFASTVPTNNASLADAQTALQAVSIPYYNSSTNQTTSTSFFDVLNTGLRGFTFFSPNNTAIEAVAASLASLTQNQTAITALFQNHLINGTTVYSPLLTSQNYTSAAGEPLSFSLNATGRYVTSGNVTALIVQPDILLPNGVIHVIDRVLVNTESDTSAASSAASSASSAATQTQPATAPIGLSATQSLTGTVTGAAATGSGGSNSAHKALESVVDLQVLASLSVAFVTGMLGGAFVIA